MLWLWISLLAYFLLAIVAILDKYLISGPIPLPKVYVFYIGILGMLSLLLIPFGFFLPSAEILFLALLSGALYIFALLGLIGGLRVFEPSRIVPAIGGILPVFTFLLLFMLPVGGKEPGVAEILAFALLILGTIFISLRKDKMITFKSLRISAASALLFSLSFVLAKFVYLSIPFWPAFIWMRIGGFMAVLFFLFSGSVRKELFSERKSFKAKTAAVFFANQAAAAGGFVLQNWAMALVPISLLPVVNALEGTKYAFVLMLAVFLSFKLPGVLKEEVSGKVIAQKMLAVFLIAGGLAVLTLGL